jgi:hypothetical protein
VDFVFSQRRIGVRARNTRAIGRWSCGAPNVLPDGVSATLPETRMQSPNQLHPPARAGLPAVGAGMGHLFSSVVRLSRPSLGFQITF